MKLARIAPVLLALALFGAACGGGTEPTATPTPSVTTPTPEETGSPSQSPPGQAEALTLMDNVFDPSQFSIAAGTQITIENQGTALHNVSIEGQDFDHDVNPGETETEDLELQPGTYTMFCKYHRAVGMEGTLTVTG